MGWASSVAGSGKGPCEGMFSFIAPQRVPGTWMRIRQLGFAKTIAEKIVGLASSCLPPQGLGGWDRRVVKSLRLGLGCTVRCLMFGSCFVSDS